MKDRTAIEGVCPECGHEVEYGFGVGDALEMVDFLKKQLEAYAKE